MSNKEKYCSKIGGSNNNFKNWDNINRNKMNNIWGNFSEENISIVGNINEKNLENRDSWLYKMKYDIRKLTNSLPKNDRSMINTIYQHLISISINDIKVESLKNIFEKIIKDYSEEELVIIIVYFEKILNILGYTSENVKDLQIGGSIESIYIDSIWKMGFIQLIIFFLSFLYWKLETKRTLKVSFNNKINISGVGGITKEEQNSRTSLHLLNENGKYFYMKNTNNNIGELKKIQREYNLNGVNMLPFSDKRSKGKLNRSSAARVNRLKGKKNGSRRNNNEIKKIIGNHLESYRYEPVKAPGTKVGYFGKRVSEKTKQKQIKWNKSYKKGWRRFV